jgi:D-arabinose 1-dehydrogenase-like Zn-dependent alcohol dehydrogenase
VPWSTCLPQPACSTPRAAPDGSALRLAERGLRVTGIDISEEEVVQARRLAAERGVGARFERGDLHSLPEEGFDAIVHWGNSFGHRLTAGPSSTSARCGAR